jgi:uncharacterized protein (TIGR03086 family)
MTPADEHRSIAGTFTDRVRGVPAGAWDNQSPVADWRARDVVRHLVEWFPSFLESGSGIVLPPVPSVDEDPVAAWTEHAYAVQAVLDDPATQERTFTHRHIPEMPLAPAISTFYTADIFLHTWDLSRATGQDERLDPKRCAAMYEGMLPMDDALRASGQYGPKVAVPDDADIQTKLLAFIGRTP